MSKYLIRLTQHLFWLFLALACAVPIARAITGGALGLSTQETLPLCVALLGGSAMVDALDDKPKRRAASKSLLAVLAAAALLFAFSLNRGPDAPPNSFVLPTLLFFGLFHWVATFPSGEMAYPSWLARRVLLLGDGPSAEKVREIIDASRGRYRLEKHIPVRLSPKGPLPHDCDDLAFVAAGSNVDTVIVSLRDRRGIMPVSGLMRCRMLGISVLDVPTFYERTTRKLYLERTTPSWFIFSPGFRLSIFRRAGKRVFDVAGAAFGLLLILPLLPCIALAVRLDSPGPAFFRQERTGLGGVPFRILKFRTMRQDAEKLTGAVWAAESDPRITRVGRFLRKTRLDELPQLFNVLLGHMSLTGPRPERPEFIRELEKDIPFYAERHCVRPGVTGWAQVRYPYGASVDDALEKLRYDLYYIKNQSFLLDMEIIFRTIAVIFLRSGAR